MAAQPDEYYRGLLNNFGVIHNNTYTYDTAYYNDNGQPNGRSITRDSVEELNKGNRYFKVMGLVEYMPGKEYIKINIFEKGTKIPVGDDTSQFGLTQRMGFIGLTPYEPAAGGKRRRTKKSKKSKRRRSFK